MHLRHHVLAIHQDARPFRRPQGDVQHGTLLAFCDVDLLAAEHRIAALGLPALLRQFQQQPDRLVGHAVLGIVQIKAGAFHHHVLATLRIIGEEFPQMRALDGFVVGLQ